MTLETINTTAQTIGVLAVLASLVFVGVQIRQNTRALKANSHHAVTDSFNAINILLMSDQNAARIFRLGLQGMENLDEDERVSCSYMNLGYMRIFETLHYQHGAGTLEAKLFEAELNTLKWAATNPGFRAWWAVNPFSFSAEFRTFFDGLIREAQESGSATVQPWNPDGIRGAAAATDNPQVGPATP